MKAVVFLLASFAILSFSVAAQDKPAEVEDAAKKAQRIDQAVAWLVNEDADVREMGKKTVIAMGRDAIPALERKLAERKATELVQVLRAIDKSPAGDPWVNDGDLHDIEVDEQYKREAEKLSRDAIEKLMYVKYQEALAHYRHKNYQRSFEMANGLLVLDSRSVHHEDYKRLKRQSETMITQTTLIEAKILQPKVWYVEGEEIELSVRMKNLYKAGMTLSWEKGTEKEPGGGVLLFDVEVSMKDMGGASVADQRHQELRFENEVPIAPGAQWEKKFVLDASTAIADRMQTRIVTIGGWSQPAKISTDGVNITRRIQFEPATVKIIAKRYEKFLENPLHWLDKMIDDGDPQQIYVCSQLLEGDDRDKGAAKLIQLLARSNTLTSKNYAANILTQLTGMSFGHDARRWESWLQNKSFETKDKDKKKK